ncbi:flagellar protein FlaG [Bacillus aerolatus]|uniref:Flagellar protein FlaG n=1 Tax=Bacillus aerolatus TaxID=2653354 RepID=A0A6I1FEZ0_9BACI|nr:flagellar protein FlaG [Bacillus aerolatus]KAB7706505.1 flagellar protein FlaG [Bacillus aerolatus]
MIEKVDRVKSLIQPVNQTGQVKAAVEQQANYSDTAQRQPDKSEMEKVVRGMNDFLKPSNTHLKFEFHDELEEYYVTMVDDITHEVIREIPSKKLLDMYAAMTEYLGVLVDKKI